jgi:hypothetical protein
MWQMGTAPSTQTQPIQRTFFKIAEAASDPRSRIFNGM